MERLKTTAWYTCSKCKKALHGENFYLLPNGCRTNECCKCYDKHIAQQRLSAEAKTLPPCGYPRCLELQQCIRDGVKRGSRECRRRAATSA